MQSFIIIEMERTPEFPSSNTVNVKINHQFGVGLVVFEGIIDLDQAPFCSDYYHNFIKGDRKYSKSIDSLMCEIGEKCRPTACKSEWGAITSGEGYLKNIQIYFPHIHNNDWRSGLRLLASRTSCNSLKGLLLRAVQANEFKFDAKKILSLSNEQLAELDK